MQAYAIIFLHFVLKNLQKAHNTDAVEHAEKHGELHQLLTVLIVARYLRRPQKRQDTDKGHEDSENDITRAQTAPRDGERQHMIP